MRRFNLTVIALMCWGGASHATEKRGLLTGQHVKPGQPLVQVVQPFHAAPLKAAGVERMGPGFNFSFAKVPVFAEGHLRQVANANGTHLEHLTARGWQPLLWPGMGMEHARPQETTQTPSLIVVPTIVTPPPASVIQTAPVSQHLLHNLPALKIMAERGAPGERANAQAILKKIQQANQTAK